MGYNMKCKCGFEIQIIAKTIRQKLRGWREQLITAKLFGCPECVSTIKKEIRRLKNEHTTYTNV
jgi:hypothetical protein